MLQTYMVISVQIVCVIPVLMSLTFGILTGDLHEDDIQFNGRPCWRQGGLIILVMEYLSVF